VNDSTSADEGGTPSLADQRPDGLWWQEGLLRAAARFSRTPGRSATLVLRRRPGLVARARAVADDLDVDGTVVIEAGGPAITLVAGRGPAAPPLARWIRRLVPVARSTARVRADRP
jgi:hypothetical protein